MKIRNRGGAGGGLPLEGGASEHEVLAVSKEKAAQMLGVSERTLHNLTRDGRLLTVAIGRRVLVPMAALHKLIGGATGSAARRAPR